MSATMEEPKVELSEENRRMIEDIATAAVSRIVAEAANAIGNAILASHNKIITEVYAAPPTTNNLTE